MYGCGKLSIDQAEGEIVLSTQVPSYQFTSPADAILFIPIALNDFLISLCLSLSSLGPRGAAAV